MKVRSRGSTALAMSAVGSVTVELETPQREGAGCESASFSGCQGSLGYEDGVGMLRYRLPVLLNPLKER